MVDYHLHMLVCVIDAYEAGRFSCPLLFSWSWPITTGGWVEPLTLHVSAISPSYIMECCQHFLTAAFCMRLGSRWLKVLHCRCSAANPILLLSFDCHGDLSLAHLTLVNISQQGGDWRLSDLCWLIVLVCGFSTKCFSTCESVRDVAWYDNFCWTALLWLVQNEFILCLKYCSSPLLTTSFIPYSSWTCCYLSVSSKISSQNSRELMLDGLMYRKILLSVPMTLLLWPMSLINGSSRDITLSILLVWRLIAKISIFATNEGFRRLLWSSTRCTKTGPWRNISGFWNFHLPF